MRKLEPNNLELETDNISKEFYSANKIPKPVYEKNRSMETFNFKNITKTLGKTSLYLIAPAICTTLIYYFCTEGGRYLGNPEPWGTLERLKFAIPVGGVLGLMIDLYGGDGADICDAM